LLLLKARCCSAVLIVVFFQELSESSALALAAKYFGFPQKGPATLAERQSDFAIDPVTPFEDMPDPDAPSKAEMMENFAKRASVRVHLLLVTTVDDCKGYSNSSLNQQSYPFVSCP
jgi:hypothetical protein